MEFEILDEYKMTPREWFAAFALQAIIAKRLNSHSMDSNDFIDAAADDAYAIADAMMFRRD